MARNLFVCHTQAQLILASGLVLGRFKDDENCLFLFPDFALGADLKTRLEIIFSKVIYLQSIYPPQYNTYWSKIFWYRKDLSLIKNNMQLPFDRLFEVCDSIYLELCILKYARLRNSNVEINWLEDGIWAYYRNITIRKGFNTNQFTLFLRSVLFKYILGLGCYYDYDFPEMGGRTVFRKIYVLYPKALREPYKSQREHVGITDVEYMLGLKALYKPRSLNIEKKSIILVMDKLDTYLHPEEVKKVVLSEISMALERGAKIYCKFHPREVDNWDIFNECQILDKNIGVESLYLSLLDRKDDVKIIGIKSTGLMSAKKLGYNVSSLFLYSGEDNENLKYFFNNIGINLQLR